MFRKAGDMKTLLPLLVLLALAAVACGNDGDNDSAGPTPTTLAPPTATQPSGNNPGPPTATPPRGAPADGPSSAGPQPGRPCPVEQRVCAMASTLLPILSNGQVDALVAMSEPVPATCPSAGLGGPSPSLCQGAAAGEVRRGFWDVQAGEGLIVPEADWRRTLQRWTESIGQAAGNDVYGPGALRVGSISCARPAGTPGGQCSADIRIHFTFINAPSLDPSRGTGLPGQRTSLHVSLHAAADGSLKVDGFGNIVPPNTVLLSFWNEYAGSDGRNMVVEYYAWTP